MRILALYPFLPYPAISGATLRGRSILDILTSRHEVTLISFVGKDDRPSELPSWKAYKAFAQQPLLVARHTEEELTHAGKKLRSLLPKFRAGLPNWLSYFDTTSMWNRIAELDLDQIDAVHIRYISMTLYALALKRAAPHLRLVVDLDDIPSVFLYRKLRHPKENPSLRSFLWQTKELYRMRSYERVALRSFDSVWICSSIDFARISKRIGKERTLVVENVVDAAKLAAIERQQFVEPAFLLIGDFSYGPNREGAEFFVDKVWPKIRQENPDAQLWLVGSHPDAKMKAWNGHHGILVTGRVEDVWPYLARAIASIAPLFGGSGTRLKILEALGAGLPVVTTSLGMEGIEARSGVDLLIADTAEEFANHCNRLLRQPELREKLAASGRSLVKEKYDISVMSRAVLKCYNAPETISGNRAAVTGSRS